MKRPTITFTDGMYEKLEKRTTEKGLKSISECVRELVDLGLRIEESAAKNTEKEDDIDLLSQVLELKSLLKNNLIWSLESRLLARLLVETNSVDTQENKIAILEQYKNKAQSYVDELVK
jgi:predicted CopG family antitoxin